MKDEKITVYQMMLVKLRSMDDKQLLEMMHDLDNLDMVERLGDCAAHYLNGMQGNGLPPFKCGQKEKSEHEDAKEFDDKQRYHDVTTCERRPY